MPRRVLEDPPRRARSHHRARGPAGRVRHRRTPSQLTGGNLAQHLTVLETAALVKREKRYVGNRARTWITLTKAGRTALRDEIGRLKLFIAQVESSRSGSSRRDKVVAVTRVAGLQEKLDLAR